MGGGAYAVVGALAVLLLMAVFYTLTANQVKDRSAKAAAAKQEADQASGRASSLQAFSSFAQVKDTRTSSVSTLATGRFDWERYLRELAAVLPDGGWLQKADASVTGSEEQNANTSGGAAPAQPALPASTLSGCVATQGDVADLMVRLRKLYLVQDVELTSAERGDGKSEATVDSCGRFVTFQVTVTFGSPAPTKREAPPGDHAVPARLGGGS